jgi:hypothetical protein
MTPTDGIEALATILRDAALFAEVVTESEPPDHPATDAPTPRAWLYSTSWTTTAAWSDTPHETRLRLVRYECEVTTRGPGLEELTDETADALHDADIGTALWCRCEDCRYPKGNRLGERKALLAGVFAYIPDQAVPINPPAPTPAYEA